jgi:hypothetical protein
LPTIDLVAAGSARWITFVARVQDSSTLYRLDLTPAVKVRSLVHAPKAEIVALTVGGGRVYYHQQSGGTDQFRSVPADGGASKPVKLPSQSYGSGTLTPLDWPWLQAGPQHGREGGFDDYQVFNLATGKAKTAKFHGTYGADFCTAEYCETGGVAFNTKGVLLQRFDGTGKHFFPGFKIDQQATGVSALLLDRYLPATRSTVSGGQLFLLDAETGQKIPVVTKSGDSGVGYLNGTGFLWFQKGSSQYVFVPR